MSDLGPLIGWYRPLADSSPDGPSSAIVIREAELLGALGRGTFSVIGIHLRSGDAEGLGVACRRLLPPATATARTGADRTAVVHWHTFRALPRIHGVVSAALE
ncbi:hypothetical protein [Streptomyces sp. NPDC006879]|uniref:hypothetical protein n=1 Tax=Streptomyces sp. NPDC006879 TaxID=3364767 RepID=UPI00367AE78A